jgi:hypothetical protein
LTCDPYNLVQVANYNTTPQRWRRTLLNHLIAAITAFHTFRNCAINNFQAAHKGSIHWEGASDVGAIEVVLGTHIK